MIAGIGGATGIKNPQQAIRAVVGNMIGSRHVAGARQSRRPEPKVIQANSGMARPSLCAAHANRLIRQGMVPVLVVVQASAEPVASTHKAWHDRLPDMSKLNVEQR